MARKVRGSGIVIGLDAGELGVERRSDRDAFTTGLDSISTILPELFWTEKAPKMTPKSLPNGGQNATKTLPETRSKNTSKIDAKMTPK